MTSIIKHLLRDSRGTAAVELGVLCLCIVVGIIAAIANLGGETDKTWTGVFNKASEAIGSS